MRPRRHGPCEEPNGERESDGMNMDKLARWTRSSGVSITVVALLMLSVGVNVMQARRIKAMEEARTAVTSVVGRPVVPLVGFSAEGVPVVRPVAKDVPAVLYYFSPTCTWCNRNWDNIRALERGAQGRYRVVLVTRARGVAQYLKERGLTMDLVEGINEATFQAYRFSGTPQTLVASIEGVITHEWKGAYTPRIERQLEELLGVTLPGIVLPANAQ
jgi:hypothetical protein